MEKTIIQSAAKEQKAVAAKKPKTMKDYVNQMFPAIEKALPSVITPERFSRIVLTALSTTPKLAQCTPASFMGAMMSAAQLGLEPNTPLGQAYLIPYKNKGVDEVQFQIGYKGLIDLAYRSGEVSTLYSQVVYENDQFKCEFGLNPDLVHIPADGDRGEPVKVYAVLKTKSGGFNFEVMSMDEVRAHAKKYSKAYSSSFSPWTTNFESMAKKTVLKKVLKYAPLSSEFVRGVTADETIKSVNTAEKDIDIFSVPDETEPIYAEYAEVDEGTGEVKEAVEK